MFFFLNTVYIFKRSLKQCSLCQFCIVGNFVHLLNKLLVLVAHEYCYYKYYYDVYIYLVVV